MVVVPQEPTRISISFLEPHGLPIRQGIAILAFTEASDVEFVQCLHLIHPASRHASSHVRAIAAQGSISSSPSKHGRFFWKPTIDASYHSSSCTMHGLKDRDSNCGFRWPTRMPIYQGSMTKRNATTESTSKLVYMREERGGGREGEKERGREGVGRGTST